MRSSIILMECARTEVSRLDSLADDVRFSDPGALGVWKDDGDGVACGLEVVYEGVHVGRGLVGGRAVVVYHENMHSELFKG